jgi:hypothetical protein
MNVLNLSEAVAAKLARLKAVQESPTSLTKYKKLLALNSELRKLREVVCDRMNALPWNEEKKHLQVLGKELDRALSNWEYQIEVDVSPKRQNELEKELSAGGLNDSTRRKLQKELQTMLALRSKVAEEARATSAAESTVPATRAAAERIDEHKAELERALRPSRDER